MLPCNCGPPGVDVNMGIHTFVCACCAYIHLCVHMPHVHIIIVCIYILTLDIILCISA